MIVRTYGRRSRSLTRGCSDDVVLGSQESSQDPYEFGFSSQESLGQWGDSQPSQESKELGIGRDNGGYGRYVSKSKKLKIGYGSDSEGLGSGFDSSQGSGGFGCLEWKNGSESLDLNSLDDGGLWKSNLIKIDDDSDPYGFNLLQKSDEFKNAVEDIPKSKKGKNGKENGILMKKEKKEKKKKKKEVTFACTIAPTVTLMETQEFGEMMEHMDEVNFALDGMRKGQPVRIRRASLLSLLSICGTSQQRRLLRAHGYLVLALFLYQ